MPKVESIERKRWHGVIALTLSVWLTTVSLGALTGWFIGLAPLAVPGLIALSIAVPTALYFSIPGLRRTIRGFGLRGLTLFHVWRISAALMFFWYGAQGELPETFVTRAGWGDLLAGLFAGFVVVLPFRRSFYAATHIFGFADLVFAVGTGATLLLSGASAMSNVGTFPLALIPLFGVGISAFTHIVAFDLLLRPELREDEKETLSVVT